MKGRRPLISVILACYNQQRFVADAVDGLLAQSYSPLEIFIVDDCSTDATAAIIESRIAAHPARQDVTFVRNPLNISGYAVCQQTLPRTSGELIMISHGDDVMMPGMLENMAAVWARRGVSLVTANAEYIDEESRPLNRTFRPVSEQADESFETLARDGSNACCFGPAIAFERDIYTRFGWVPRYLGAYDIMYPFYAYLLKGASFLRTPLLKYRVHSQNTSLSLAAEKTGEGIKQLAVLESIHFGHLAHAVLMQEELERACAQDRVRYWLLARRIAPLIAIQIREMARKLAHTRRALDDLGARLTWRSTET